MIIHDVKQGSQEWVDLHCGIPTTSEFGNLITSTGGRSNSLDDYAKILAADAYAGKALDRFSGNKYTDRGTEQEPDARVVYEYMKDVQVEQVGFITPDDGSYGCSPDGLVGKDGLVEFKCQIAKEHVKALLYYRKNGKCPTTYVAQTQGQMFSTKRKWCDLVFYHPDLPTLIIRQKPAPAIFRGIKEQIQAVIEERDSILEELKSFTQQG